MSIRVQSYVWEKSKAEGSALLLLLAIADHAHDDGGGAYPSVETLAHKCRQTERNTQLLLRKLEEMGEIITQRAAGPYGCNIYTIPLRGEKISPPLKSSVAGGEKQRTRGVKSSARKVHQFSPEPSDKPSTEPSVNIYTASPVENSPLPEKALEDETFGALMKDVQERVTNFTPRMAQELGELWDEYPDIDAHIHAMAQTDKFANGFNVKYYESCLSSWWAKHKKGKVTYGDEPSASESTTGGRGQGRPDAASGNRQRPDTMLSQPIARASGETFLPRVSGGHRTGARSDPAP